MNDNKSSGGISFASALFLVLFALKLTGNIAWPWWAVFGPLWMPVAAVIAVMVVLFALSSLLMGLGQLIETVQRTRDEKRQREATAR